MKRQYIKFDKAIEMLNDGWVIYTDRGFGGAPYDPLFYRLCKGDKGLEVHHSTIRKLIKENVINGYDVEKGMKYKLKNPSR